VEANQQVKLRIDNLSLGFGGVSALIDVSIEIRDKEILAIIGPNGAGKTALLNCINGFTNLKKVRYTSRTRELPDATGQAGQTGHCTNLSEYRTLYRLSTQDNLMAARHVLMKQNFVTGALYVAGR